jgi:hypothetical protein
MQTKGARIMTIQVIDKTNGSIFDVNDPDIKDIETAKSFLIDYNYPFFTLKTNWDDYEFKIIEA